MPVEGEEVPSDGFRGGCDYAIREGYSYAFTTKLETYLPGPGMETLVRLHPYDGLQRGLDFAFLTLRPRSL